MEQNNQTTRHAELFGCYAPPFRSASWHKTPQTLNQVQGDDNGKNGFTLVELAIALMVIGLLIGGVLKGQELIENTKVTATIRQINAYDTAVMIFRNTYNALPGDIKRPNRIPNCTTDLCLTAGNGDGKIHANFVAGTIQEWFNFFPHLSKAGMIQGPEGGTLAQVSDSELFFPSIPVDGQIDSINYSRGDIFSANLSERFSNPNKHYYNMVTALQYAEPIDIKIDDGLPCSGFVLIMDTGDCENTGNTYVDQNWVDGNGDPIHVETGF